VHSVFFARATAEQRYDRLCVPLRVVWAHTRGGIKRKNTWVDVVVDAAQVDDLDGESRIEAIDGKAEAVSGDGRDGADESVEMGFQLEPVQAHARR
jgi:hypothetical protein